MFKKLPYRLFRRLYALNHFVAAHLTPAGALALALLVAAAVFGIDTRQTLTYQFFTFLLALFAVALILSLRTRLTLSAERRVASYGTVGEPLTYSVVLHNPDLKKAVSLILFEELADPRPDFALFAASKDAIETRRNPFDRFFGYYRWRWLVRRQMIAASEKRAVPDIAPGAARVVEMALKPLYRGRLSFSRLVIARPDPLGLICALHRIKAPQSVIILPRRYPVPAMALPGSRRYQSGGVAQASNVGESEEFVSLRDYRPGDPLRRIHWKSWARTGRPIVKEYQDEFFVRYALVLDTFQRAAFSETFEAAVSVAASLAQSVATGDSLLDMIFVKDKAYCFTTGRGVTQKDRMQEILAAVTPCMDKDFDLLPPVVLQRAGLLAGVILVLLAWGKDRQAFVRRLKSMGLPLLVLVVIPGGGERERPLDPAFDLGPMADEPRQLRLVRATHLQEDLAAL